MRLQVSLLAETLLPIQSTLFLDCILEKFAMHKFWGTFQILVSFFRFKYKMQLQNIGSQNPEKVIWGENLFYKVISFY